MLINDVGQDTWEEINEGVPGATLGWPATEGLPRPWRSIDPVNVGSDSHDLAGGHEVLALVAGDLQFIQLIPGDQGVLISSDRRHPGRARRISAGAACGGGWLGRGACQDGLVRRFEVAERRARLWRRHCLSPAGRAASPVEASERLVCLHATDPATVYLAAWARVDGFKVPDMDRALYTDRSLVKQLCMRRTLFVFRRQLLGTIAGGGQPAASPTRNGGG